MPDRQRVLPAVACAALLLGGCSDGQAPQEAAPSASATADPEGAAEGTARLGIRLRLGEVTGRLRPRPAKRDARQVARVVDGWFEAAYLAGEWPRTRFTDAFPGFTDGAVREARRDRRLMSNVAVAGDVEAVVPRLKRMEVDLLAVERESVGATTRFHLVFETEGTYARRVTVAGRLYLTRGPAGTWRVFGYDVRRAAAGGSR